MNGYYSVFNPRGQKIADCGSEKDAVNLMSMRNARWDGHYYQFKPLYETVLLEKPKLPTKDIAVNMDGGVGGSWKEVEYIEVDDQKLSIRKLPQNYQETFIPDFHD